MLVTHHIVIVERKNQKYDFEIVHANGNLLCQSTQGYENEADARTVGEGIIAAGKNGTIKIGNRKEA